MPLDDQPQIEVRMGLDFRLCKSNSPLPSREGSYCDEKDLVSVDFIPSSAAYEGDPDQRLRNGCRIDLRALLKVEALRDSCRSSKALLLGCHLPIGALPFSRFLLGTGVQLAANRFGRSIPPSKPCCIGGAKDVIGSDP
jgi:hypothetical protein